LKKNYEEENAEDIWSCYLSGRDLPDGLKSYAEAQDKIKRDKITITEEEKQDYKALFEKVLKAR